MDTPKRKIERKEREGERERSLYDKKKINKKKEDSEELSLNNLPPLKL